MACSERVTDQQDKNEQNSEKEQNCVTGGDTQLTWVEETEDIYPQEKTPMWWRQIWKKETLMAAFKNMKDCHVETIKFVQCGKREKTKISWWKFQDRRLTLYNIIRPSEQLQPSKINRGCLQVQSKSGHNSCHHPADGFLLHPPT